MQIVTYLYVHCIQLVLAYNYGVFLFYFIFDTLLYGVINDFTKD